MKGNRSLIFCGSVVAMLLLIAMVNGASVAIDDEFHNGIPLKVVYQGKYNEDDARSLFQHFKKLYLKKYPSDGEHEKRWQIFYENINYVNQINIMHLSKEKEGNPVQYGITQFMDMTPTEFSRKMLLPTTKEKDIKHTPTAPKEKYQIDGPLPENFDWREHGAVTPVKNQASCGSCWAFSTVQNIEGAYFLSGRNLTQFSPQQLVDCDYLNCGCFGGYPYVAMNYIKQRGGLAAETAYPYCIPPLGTCFPCNTNKSFCPSPEFCNRTCEVQNYQLVAKISGYENVSQNEDEIAAFLVKNGPLSIGLNAVWLQFYHSGISDPMYCPPDVNHAVLLVGFGVHTNWLGEKVDYWLVKNSWGESWGEKGYFRIVRGKEKCGINTIVANALIQK